MATTKHGSFSPDFNASDSHYEIVGKTKEMLKKNRIKSPDLKKLFCVEFNDAMKTRRYTASEERYNQLLKLKSEMEAKK